MTMRKKKITINTMKIYIWKLKKNSTDNNKLDTDEKV